MAGGSEWVSCDEMEESPPYQKVAGGPWYKRRRISVEIERTVRADQVSIFRNGGVLGSKSGILIYRRARALVTIALSDPEKFVCTMNRVINDVPQSTTVKQRQRWTLESTTETTME